VDFDQRPGLCPVPAADAPVSSVDVNGALVIGIIAKILLLKTEVFFKLYLVT
jgi:hypothetical protein